MPVGTTEKILEVTKELITFLEEYDESYFLTITLKPKLYKYNSITQLELTCNELYSILYRCTDAYYIVAEHTKACNVHYHAVVKFKTPMQKVFLINVLKRQTSIGFVKLEPEPVKDKKAVVNYMTKELYNNLMIFTSIPGHKPYCYMNHRLWYEIINN